MSDLARLRESVERIEQAYEVARQELELDVKHRASFGAEWPSTPDQCRDANGRFILLDSLTAIVQARAILVQAGGSGA